MLTERMDQFQPDAETPYDITKSGFEEVPEYELFIQCFAEQSIVEEGKRRWISKDDQSGKFYPVVESKRIFIRIHSL